MHERIKEWYASTYNDQIAKDNLAPNLTFWELLEWMIEWINFYSMIWTERIDSIIRENVFRELCWRTGISYQTIYNLWIKNWDTEMDYKKQRKKQIDKEKTEELKWELRKDIYNLTE